MEKAKPEELICSLEERITELSELFKSETKRIYDLDKRLTKMENRETGTLRILQDMVNLLTKK